MQSWNEYCPAKKLEFFQKNDEDCEFRVGMDGMEEPKLFRSFKFILSSVSPVFERMFNGSFLEANCAVPIAITDIYADDFQVFLHYVYGENPYVRNWRSLHEIAKKYMADEVLKSIYQQVKSMKKTPIEALQLFEITLNEHQNLRIPTDSSELTSTARVLIQAFETQCVYMFCMDPDTFLKLIEIVKVHVPAVKVFQTINSYWSHERNNHQRTHKTHLIKIFMNQVDFSNISIEQFLKFVEPSEILDVNAKHKILVDLCRHNLQDNVSFSGKRRGNYQHNTHYDDDY